MLVPLSSTAQLRVAGIFGSHMVLQRNKPITIWGWAKKGDKIEAELNGATQTALADSGGKWKLVFSPMEAGGPFEIRVSDTKTQIKLTDILIGEVWICSGQSNMEFAVKSGENGIREIANANNSQIRHIKIPNELSMQPQEDISNAEWKVSSPSSTGDFTAVGYEFAKSIYSQIHVPIGLINASWGGSQIEGWISKDALISSDEFQDYAKNMPLTWDANFAMQENRLKTYFFTNTGVDEKTSAQAITSAGYDFSKWKFYGSPGNYDWMWPWGFRGELYIEREVNLQAYQAGKNSVINLGINDSKYEVYINGKLISTGQQKNITIHLPSATFKEGSNTILLKIGAQIGVDWMGMGIHGEAADINLEIDGEKISLAGNKWRTLPDISGPYKFIKLNNSEASILYNSLINPLIDFNIQGVLWYQGEANTMRAWQYQKAFPLLINNWRAKWHQSFPFLFVQLSAFGTNLSSNFPSEWAELREAQLKALELPATGMAVTIDVGNADDIHPKNKKVVGERLAAIALNNCYHIARPWAGPELSGFKLKRHSVQLFFKNNGDSLVARDKFGYLRGFEIAGADQHFVYAKAEIRGNSVIVFAPDNIRPASVRYGWSNAPTDINLFNSAGFPASPFRTDQWPTTTLKRKFGDNL